MEASPPPREASGKENAENGHSPSDVTSDKGKCDRARLLQVVKENLLLLCLILSMFLGILLGCCLRLVEPPLTYRQQIYLQFPGEIFMNMLKSIILPLIVITMLAGVTSLDAKTSGKIAARAIMYYVSTMFIAVVLGVVLVLVFRPGKGGEKPDLKDVQITKKEAADTFLDLIRQLFPSNIVEAAFKKKLTTMVKIEPTKEEKAAGGNNTKPKYRPELKYFNGINVLGILVFSIALGIAINTLGSKGQQLKDLISVVSDAVIVLVTFVMWYSPIGVLFLVAGQIVKMADPVTTFTQLGYYFLTVMFGIGIHCCIVLPTLYFFLVRKNPFKFIKGVLQALVTALGTSSSSATIPITMRNLEENNHIDSRITSFVVPVGATINMDGTALYEAVAVIFIGQVNGIELDVAKVITISLMATIAAVGAAGIPSAGLVTMVLVLNSVGFPLEGIGMIWAIDWLLDRFRTATNVLGDAIGAGIVYHYSMADLEERERASQETGEVKAGNKDTEPDDVLRVVDSSGLANAVKIQDRDSQDSWVD